MFYISFFKKFKDWNNLTVNEKIVYSFLVNYGTMHQIDSWDKSSERDWDRKKLDMSVIKNCIDEYSYLKFRKITNKKISEKTGISLRTVSTILNKFKKIDILNKEEEDYYKIEVPKGFIDKGFLNLPKNTDLKGMQLVFWAFINERLIHYNEKRSLFNNTKIDTWASRLAMDMGVKKKDIQNYIHSLTQKNYLQRTNNCLTINKISTQTNTRQEFNSIEEYDLPF